MNVPKWKRLWRHRGGSRGVAAERRARKRANARATRRVNRFLLAMGEQEAFVALVINERDVI